MYVEGFDNPLYYAMQLPDPSEPRSNYRIMDFLDKLGLGDREAIDRLFLATLGRWSTDEEFEILLSTKTADYEQWLADCQWALLNKLE